MYALRVYACICLFDEDCFDCMFAAVVTADDDSDDDADDDLDDDADDDSDNDDLEFEDTFTDCDGLWDTMCSMFSQLHYWVRDQFKTGRTIPGIRS